MNERSNGTDQIIDPALSYVNLSDAKLFQNHASGIGTFFQKSGNEFLLKELRRYLPEDALQLVFFEHSYFATILDDNQSAVFACIWTQRPPDSLSDGLSRFSAFFSKINDTLEKDHPVLWHRLFALFPPKPLYYVAGGAVSSPASDLSFEAGKYIPSVLPEGAVRLLPVPGGQAYTANFTFRLDYWKKVKEAVTTMGSETIGNLTQNNEYLRLIYDEIFREVRGRYSYNLAIPMLGSPAGQSRFSGQGAGFIYLRSDKSIPHPDLDHAAKCMASHMKDMSINYIFHSGLDLADKNLQQSRKAAVSQVMSRNMSHNVGSHVLAKLSTEQSLAGGGYHRIAKLNEYLKLRMDFLADIATSVPTFELSKNLRHDVLNVFNRQADSGTQKNYQELLLQHITGNEKTVEVALPAEKYYASFPNDLLGAQALYIIIENIIRNTAKHSNSGKRQFAIRCLVRQDDAYPEYTSLTICDNCETLASNSDLVAHQNARIALPMLKEGGELRQNAWGVLEMKISAAYLRKIAPADIDRPVSGPPIIQAVAEGNDLGYRIYLLKPKHLLLIDGSKGSGLTPAQQVQLREYGIWYERPERIADLTGKAFNHELLLVLDPDASLLSTIAGQEKNFPLRRMYCQDDPAFTPLPGFLPLLDCNPASLLEILRKMDSKEKAGSFLKELWHSRIAHLQRSKGIEAFHLQFWDAGPGGEDRQQGAGLEIRTAGRSGQRDREKQVVFFHHTSHQYSSLFRNSFYFEQYGSASLILPFLTRVRQGDPLATFQLAESLLTCILLVDERIQDIAEKERFPYVSPGEGQAPPSVSDLLERAGIFVLPQEVANLNAPVYDKDLVAAVGGWVREQAPAADLVAIHLGVLERMNGTALVPDEEKPALIKACLDRMQAWNPSLRIVVISGRGKPDTLPPDTFFLHYSLISQYILENRSKFHLTQLLYSARKQ